MRLAPSTASIPFSSGQQPLLWRSATTWTPAIKAPTSAWTFFPSTRASGAAPSSASAPRLVRKTWTPPALSNNISWPLQWIGSRHCLCQRPPDENASRADFLYTLSPALVPHPRLHLLVDAPLGVFPVCAARINQLWRGLFLRDDAAAGSGAIEGAGCFQRL